MPIIRRHFQPSSRLAPPRALAALLAVALLCAFAPPQQQVPPPPAPTPTAQSQEQQNAPAEGPEQLHLLVGRSLVITSPTRVRRVSLADPNIAEAVVISPYQVLVNGKQPGGVSLVLWNESDQSQTFEVLVDMDILALSQKLRESFPEEQIQVEAAKDVVVVSGKVSSSSIADKIMEVVKTSGAKAVSLMEVPPPPRGEILLQVKFAEVDRTALSQLGINIISLPGNKNIGTISTQQFSPPTLSSLTSSTSGTSAVTTNFTLSDLLNIFIFRPDIDLAATIKALQQKNLLEILAEPNLLTASGRDASFLAGGEFPFPVAQGVTGGPQVITIQFREFGVRLNFTPVLREDGMIHLKVRPEVSSLDFANALTLSGFLVPALSTRRVESEMDLRDGQSFAIAGLVDNRVTQQFQKIPGLGDIPLFGKLFQSRSLNKTKNELLVVVTPRIVKPAPEQPLPTGPQFPSSLLDQGAPGGAKPPAPH